MRGLRPACRGFSMVEALLVVFVVLVLAALAVPSMLRARMKANEAAALGNMRAIQTAEAMYNNSYPQVGYSSSLVSLGGNGTNCETPSKTNACLLMDETLISGLKSGYTFDLVTDGESPARAYTLTAAPESSGTTGRCTFVADQTGAIGVEIPGTSASSKARHSIAAGNTACVQS